MPIDNTMLRINYNLMFENIYPIECILEQSGIVRCQLTWLEARAKTGFLQRLVEQQARTEMYRGKIIWFQDGDPHKGSKPFDILWIGLDNLSDCGEPITVILVVRGQKTERIKKKWIGKLTILFGYPVNIIWEEDTQ